MWGAVWCAAFPHLLGELIGNCDSRCEDTEKWPQSELRMQESIFLFLVFNSVPNFLLVMPDIRALNGGLSPTFQTVATSDPYHHPTAEVW